ncbi:MAG: hypothetical protein ACE366_06065 [Bradymonadia bacterium]
MPQFTEFPVLPQGEYTQAVDAFIRLIRGVPPEGEPFSSFRKRLKKASMWSRDRLIGLLRFLQIPHADPIMPSEFMTAVTEADGLEGARDVITARLWAINPLLFKAVLERLEERVHSPNELFKYVDSFAYPGARLSHPEMQNWIKLAQGLGVLKPVGIRVAADVRGEQYLPEALDLDIEDFLEEDQEEIWPPPGSDTGSAGATSAEAATDETAAASAAVATVAPAPTPSVVTTSASAPAAPQAVRSSAHGAPSVVPTALALPSSLSDPHQGSGTKVRLDQIRASEGLSASLQSTLAERIEGWWSDQTAVEDPYPLNDFHFDAEAWMEDPQRALFRLAVGAAFAFRLGRSPDQARQAFEHLDAVGVLDDLFLGTVPDHPPVDLDPQGLMLASLVARRLAESPDLATDLERQKDAESVLQALEKSLGRGLFSIELFWMLRRLDQLGVVRVPGAVDVRALPTRSLREALFRFGVLDSPYASNLADLVKASQAARALVAAPGLPDQVILSFAQAAQCAFGCPQRKRCGLPCRERVDLG